MKLTMTKGRGQKARLKEDSRTIVKSRISCYISKVCVNHERLVLKFIQRTMAWGKKSKYLLK